MSYKSFKQVSFSRSQRNGILILFMIVIGLQFVLIYADKIFPHKNSESDIPLALQQEYDSLRKLAIKDRKKKIYPFNPNYLTDSRGYYLGMQLDEIDKVKAFRKTGKYFQSKQEFKQISDISDSLFTVLEPYINIPDYRSIKYDKPLVFTGRKLDINKASATDFTKISGIGGVLSKRIVKFRNSIGGFTQKSQLQKVYGLKPEVVQKVWQHFYLDGKKSSVKLDKMTLPVVKKDINKATEEDLRIVKGIGEKLSARIVKYRESVGGFVLAEQLNDVYGLKPEVAQRIWQYFSIQSRPVIAQKIDVNDANIKELAKNPYISYELSKKIVSYRTLHGAFAKCDDLLKMSFYPKKKHKLICLYLTIEK